MSCGGDTSGYVCGDDARWVHSVDKEEIVKSYFKQLYKHFVFVEDGDGGRKSPEKLCWCEWLYWYGLWRYKECFRKWGYYMMRWIIKKKSVPTQLTVTSSLPFWHSTWYMNKLLLYLLMLMCRCRGCIIVSKRFFNWHRSIDIRFLLSPYGIPMVEQQLQLFWLRYQWSNKTN